MIDLPVLHDFSDVGVKKYASIRFLEPDRWKIGQLPDVVVGRLPCLTLHEQPKVWLEYYGTAGKPGGKRRKQTSACSHGRPQSTRLSLT